MTGSDGHSGGSTAAELIAKLETDKDYQRKQAISDAELWERATLWRGAEQPIVAGLSAVNVHVESVWDLVKTAKPYPAALPVLVEHLEHGDYPQRVLEGVARALAVKPANVYWNRLRKLYVQAAGRDLTEGLAVALAAAADAKNLDDLLALLGDESRGETRIHFIRPILKLGGVRGRRVVEDLQSDPIFGKEATALLSRTK